jgi:P4 family phage/plasmid primase-like protien
MNPRNPSYVEPDPDPSPNEIRPPDKSEVASGSNSQTPEQKRRKRKEREKKELELSIEAQLATTFTTLIPPLRCVGDRWFCYVNGYWEEISRDTYLSLAFHIQSDKHRTARMAHSILSHVEGVHQFDERLFRSFYYREPLGRIFINCQNEIICVNSHGIVPDGVFRFPHSEDRHFTKQLAANYNPSAKAEIFNRVLADALPDDADRLLFQNFVGSLLLPNAMFEAVLVCYGPTGAAKSTLAGGIKAALGPDVITNLTLAQICDPRCFHLNKLQQAAVNISTELNALAVSSENFKRIASGEAIDADRKYQDSIDLTTTCKLWFLTNDLPRFESGSDAELRRLRFLRFFKRPWEVDPTLKERIEREGDGILNFMLTGLLDLLRRREMPFGSTGSIQTRERFRIQNDPLGTFVETQCELGPEFAENKEFIESAYNEFCADNGIPVFKNTANLFKRLYEKFPLRPFRSRQAGDVLNKVGGIRLKDDE